jgi:hypothetical protein
MGKQSHIIIGWSIWAAEFRALPKTDNVRQVYIRSEFFPANQKPGWDATRGKRDTSTAVWFTWSAGAV